MPIRRKYSPARHLARNPLHHPLRKRGSGRTPSSIYLLCFLRARCPGLVFAILSRISLERLQNHHRRGDAARAGDLLATSHAREEQRAWRSHSQNVRCTGSRVLLRRYPPGGAPLNRGVGA